ncbi:hypothetical protein [Cupriavidus pauculus]|uniref:hypothetical protein n=1 Tax=Cupriavidus pauculus TaxID=82633 RepID=UPI000B2CCB2F|nr:hypothetical protein [Cupriavidus pauculus]
MLSAHEVAALMVLHSRGACFGIDPKDLAALATHKLVELRHSTPADRFVKVTPKGARLVGAIASTRQARWSLLFLGNTYWSGFSDKSAYEPTDRANKFPQLALRSGYKTCGLS